MLQPLMHRLSQQHIVLASGSPRRKTILQNVGLAFEVIPSMVEENLPKEDYNHPYEYATATASLKTLDVARKLAVKQCVPDLIIGADTVVASDDVIYEKPRDKEHAFQILSSFCGKSHTVYTGVVLVRPKSGVLDSSLSDDERFDIRTFHEGTRVEFADVSAETIRSYIETGEPMDKAGGYGIQAAGGTLVKSVHGDYFNVMGFPLHKFAVNVCQIYS